MVAAIVAALGLAAAFTAGYWLAVHRLTARVEAMHAAMVASRLDTSPQRAATADRHRNDWRSATRPHLPNRRSRS